MIKEKKSENHESKKVKLETLLQLKRLEQPSEQFWGQFDRELKEKMLGSLVKKNIFSVQYFTRIFKISLPRLIPASVAALFIFAVWLNNEETTVDSSRGEHFMSEIGATQFKQFVVDELGVSFGANTFRQDLSPQALYASNELGTSGIMEYTTSGNVDSKPGSRSIVY